MKLPSPQPRYDASVEARRNIVLEQADALNFKRGTDVELYNEKLILRSPDGSRWKITVSNAGVISAVAL